MLNQLHICISLYWQNIKLGLILNLFPSLVLFTLSCIRLKILLFFLLVYCKRLSNMSFFHKRVDIQHIYDAFFLYQNPWINFSKWPRTQWILFDRFVVNCVLVLCFGFSPAWTLKLKLPKYPEHSQTPQYPRLHFSTMQHDREDLKHKCTQSLPVRTWLLPHQRQVIVVISLTVPPLNL